MKKTTLLAASLAIATVVAGCSSSGDSSSGDCPSEPFTGDVSSVGDDENAAFSLSDGDIVLAQAVALAEGAQYTVYLADYDLGGQVVGGSATIEADDGQVVITMQARNPDQEFIEPGTAYEEHFVIMDSGGGASGAPDEPEGTVTFIAITDDQLCFDVAFEDPGIGQVLEGTVSAEIAD